MGKETRSTENRNRYFMTILRCKLLILGVNIENTHIYVGDCEVGKTSIVQMFVSNGKSANVKNYQMTTFMDISIKTINIPDSDISVELYICDTSGSDMFSDVRSIAVCFYFCLFIDEGATYVNGRISV